MFIETPRLLLREWKELDIIPFSKINADPKVMEFFPKTLTQDETKAFVQVMNTRFMKDGFSFCAVELKATGEVIGMIGLNKPDYTTPFTPCVEIGWRISSEHWNKGYATEGALACLKYGFEVLTLDKIASFTAVQNVRSQRIMEKIGMKRDLEGDFNHPKLPLDHPLSLHALYWISR